MKYYPLDIENMKGNKDVDGLIQAAKKGDFDIRKNAIKALGEIGDPKAVDVLVEAMPSEETAIEAIAALGEIGGEDAILALISGLGSSGRFSTLYHLHISYVLKNHKEQSIPHLLKFFSLYEDESYMKLPKENQGLSRKQSLRLRGGIAFALGVIEDIRAEEALLVALDDNDQNIRKASIYAVGQIKSKKAVEPLITALKSKKREIREAAAYALGDIKDKRAIKPLAEALRDKKKQVRSETKKALEKIGTQDALKAIESV